LRFNLSFESDANGARVFPADEERAGDRAEDEDEHCKRERARPPAPRRLGDPLNRDQNRFGMCDDRARRLLRKEVWSFARIG
jgi:hypothetical protein